MDYVLTLRDLPRWTNLIVGGKGSALAEITRIGCHTPEAFAVTVEAYREFINQPEAREALLAALARLQDHPDATVIEETATALQAVLLNVSIPTHIADEIRAAYSQLGSEDGAAAIPVAVRSSATAEDLPDASFAGQHDSFLYIRGVSDLLASVRKCWASLWTARAITYRQRRGIDHEKVLMAVMVQRMVKAEVSGVLFTLNPLTGDPSQVVVNAVYGLGEALVSGEATPDQWVLDKRTGGILESSIADKNLMAVEAKGSVTRIEVPASKRRKPSVSTEKLLNLKDAGVLLEEHFGHPQDVEWAFENGRPSILQSRAVTTTQRSDAGRAGNAFQVAKGYWTRAGLGEWFQLPLSQLFSTLVLPKLSFAIDSLLEEQLGIRRASPTWLVLNGYYYMRGDIVLTPRLFITPLRFLRKIRKIPDDWDTEVVPKHIDRIRQLREFQAREASTTEIFQHLEEVCSANARCLSWIVLTGAFAKLSEFIFKRSYEFVMGKREVSYATLLGGFSNKSVEADESLWQLSETARASQELKAIILHDSPSEALNRLALSESSRDWFNRFQDWLNSYGHAVFELDILYETMQDNPAIALQVVRNYIENPVESPAARQKRKAEERRNAEDDFQKLLANRFWFKGVLRKVLSLAQRYAAIRESRPFYLHMGWPIMRRDVLELGRRLAKSGALQDASDVFFLTFVELRNWSMELDPRRPSATRGKDSIVRDRRREGELQKSLVPRDHINPNYLARFFSRRFLSNRQNEREPSVLIGTPGSPGKALGSTCLVKSHRDFGKFKQGQILVAPYTTPVWTSLLSLAAGVVTETGGALSHAAIIAREYGIPAVVGVANAVARIPDGTNLEVDGSAGRVSLMAAQRLT